MNESEITNVSIVVKDLTVSYPTPRTGRVQALGGVSLTLKRGEVRGVAGESGSGKSTLIRSMLGILDSNSLIEHGEIEIHGVDVLRARRSELRSLRRKEIGYVGQNPLGCLHPLRSVRQQLSRRIKDSGADPAGVELIALLESLGIRSAARVLDLYPHQLSGGMAQRAITAIALAPRPSLVIADEPTSGLDLTVQRQVLDELVGGVASAGASLLIVTHDLGVVANYCNTLTVMNQGEVVEEGPVDQVLTSPRAAYTRRLIESIPRPDEVIEA